MKKLSDYLRGDEGTPRVMAESKRAMDEVLRALAQFGMAENLSPAVGLAVLSAAFFHLAKHLQLSPDDFRDLSRVFSETSIKSYDGGMGDILRAFVNSAAPKASC